jgi:AraC-like DNA-binding protein
MMHYYFDFPSDRTVIEANHIFYTCPVMHPDRTMDVHDLFYVLEGQERVWLEDEEIINNTGDVTLLPAKYHHYGLFPFKTNTHAIYLHFTTAKEDHPVKKNETVSSNAIVVPSYLHTFNLKIFEYFQDVAKIYKSNSPHKVLKCQAVLNLLLAELSDTYRQQDFKNNQIIDDVLALLANHPHKFYTISELSKYTGLCPKTLTSHFRVATGQSIHKYQINSKLEQIEALLRNRYTNLRALALNFGFYDEYHLNSCFKKKYGISPIRYSKGLHK